ncbi:MAG: hypothetical protein ABJA71_11290 [Ginsengibacter sp.]
MAINIVESVQQKLNVDELQKIDPNTGKPVESGSSKTGNIFYQAAIPAVLTGLYKFTRTDDGNKEILNGKSGNLLSSFFGEHRNDVISKVADITETTAGETDEKMEKIAEAGMSILKENLPQKSLEIDVKNFLTGQRHNILLYLDPVLKLGHHIEDNTVDDSINKMEGPVSDLMHNIGQIFSASGNDQKKDI